MALSESRSHAPPCTIGAASQESAELSELSELLPPAQKHGAADDDDDVAALRAQVEEHARRLKELEAQLKDAAPTPSRSTKEMRAARSSGRKVACSASDISVDSPGEEDVKGESNSPPRSPRVRMGGAAIRPQLKDCEGSDPYNDMWSAARMPELRAFDQNLLNNIYNKPHREVRHQAALFGSGIVGLAAMPFGPIGMAAGGMFGAVCGGIVGLCADRRRMKKKIEESELEKKRLKSLVRWASERLSEEDEVFSMVEMVTLEFKPMADIASGSKTARKQLRLLDQWAAQKSVNRQLWLYMDNLLQHWQDLTRAEFIRAMSVFETLSTMYKFTRRALSEKEAQFVTRMQCLLCHSSVQSVLAHAYRFPREDESRAMECMVFADHHRSLHKKGRSSEEVAQRSPSKTSHDGPEVECPSEDSDGERDDAESVHTLTLAAPVICSPVGPQKVLKKPFFRSWDDFMEFDEGFKRKMPITLSEFNLLLDKETESTGAPWDLCVDRKEIRVAKMVVGGGVITLRAWATVPGVDIKVAFYLFSHTKERQQWDKVFAQMYPICEPQHGSEIIYSLMRITGVTPRDFLQYRRARILDDNSIAIVLRSAEHQECPEGKSCIRAESYIGGYVLRQEFENGQPVLKVFLMSCSDVKGFIPKWIINMVAPKKPAEWVDSLKKACLSYQEANPSFRTDLEEYIDKYREENPWDYEVVECSAPETNIEHVKTKQVKTKAPSNSLPQGVTIKL